MRVPWRATSFLTITQDGEGRQTDRQVGWWQISHASLLRGAVNKRRIGLHSASIISMYSALEHRAVMQSPRIGIIAGVAAEDHPCRQTDGSNCDHHACALMMYCIICSYNKNSSIFVPWCVIYDPWKTTLTFHAHRAFLEKETKSKKDSEEKIFNRTTGNSISIQYRRRAFDSVLIALLHETVPYNLLTVYYH